jgi:hypothetical protein
MRRILRRTSSYLTAMSKASNSQEPPNGGSDQRFVRLRDAVRGQYCPFEKGEVVKLSGELDSLRMERVKWRNSLTLSNVLCNVPNWLILYEDAEEPNETSGATEPKR